MKALILLSLMVFPSISATVTGWPHNGFVSNDNFYHVSLEPLTWFAAQEVPLVSK